VERERKGIAEPAEDLFHGNIKFPGQSLGNGVMDYVLDSPALVEIVAALQRMEQPPKHLIAVFDDFVDRQWEKLGDADRPAMLVAHTVLMKLTNQAYHIHFYPDRGRWMLGNVEAEEFGFIMFGVGDYGLLIIKPKVEVVA